MSPQVLRIGTRGSPLAMAQTSLIAAALTAYGVPTELVSIRTHGDIHQGPLTEIGGTGVFAAALRTAVLEDSVDIAVHSLKDLPTAPVAGLTLAAIPERADARDALCCPAGHTLAQLPPGAVIGTGSPRRAAQARRVRPDLTVVAIRGNVDTRLRLAESGQVDAVILAVAGLQRLGREGAITQLLPFELCLPAPGQGALAIECREGASDPTWYGPALAALDHHESRVAVLAERAFLAALEAGCTAPVGAHAIVDGDSVTLTGAAMALDGSVQLRDSAIGSTGTASELGAQLADSLLARGAADLLGDPPTSTP